MKIVLGVPADMRDQAAALYWEAFGEKLGRVMGPAPRATRFIARSIAHYSRLPADSLPNNNWNQELRCAKVRCV